MKTELPKILIVCTTPYSKEASSRAFGSYFGAFGKENLAQIMSLPIVPPKGQCGSIFRITDEELIKSRFSKKQTVGTIFHFEDMREGSAEEQATPSKKGFLKKAYRFFKARKGAFSHLVRKCIWKKKYWDTSELEKWVDDFQPDLVYCSFSDDFFIQDIALHFSKKYNIPLVFNLGDDYYFNDRFSLSPFYWIYRKSYKKQFEAVMKASSGATFISDRIREKYVQAFDVSGKTVYLSAPLNEPGDLSIHQLPVISYFGNLGYGRYKSLADIGDALQSIDPSYKVDVYSSFASKKMLRYFAKHPGVCFHGRINYQEITEKTRKTDLLLIVEGFDRKSIKDVKYSLSTKVADSLSSGKLCFCYGDRDTGAMDFLLAHQLGVVVTKQNDLAEVLRKVLGDEGYRSSVIEREIEFAKDHFDLKKNSAECAEYFASVAFISNQVK